jgi:hypothetical protein
MSALRHAEPIWLHEHPSSHGAPFRIGREGDELVAEWVGLGVLRARRGSGASEFTPAPGAAPEAIERLLAGPAAAFARHARGAITLHASAVELAGRAVAFVGISGGGKSTLAAHVCAAHGASLIADDLLYVDLAADGVVATSTARAHRLFGDARAALGIGDPGDDKQEVTAARVAERPVRVEAIVRVVFDGDAGDLGDDARVHLTPARGPAAFLALSESLFRLSLDDADVQRRDFDALADIAARVRLLELRRPRGLARLAEAGRLVAALARREEAP